MLRERANQPRVPWENICGTIEEGHMAEMTWREAITQVLSETDGPMHYTDIAQAIIDNGYRRKVGANPEGTVAASLSQMTQKSQVVRMKPGTYSLTHSGAQEAHAAATGSWAGDGSVEKYPLGSSDHGRGGGMHDGELNSPVPERAAAGGGVDAKIGRRSKVTGAGIAGPLSHLDEQDWWVYLQLRRPASGAELARRAWCQRSDLVGPLERLSAEGLIRQQDRVHGEDAMYHRAVELAPSIKSLAATVAGRSEFSETEGPPRPEVYPARDLVARAQGTGVPEELSPLRGSDWWVFLQLDKPTSIAELAERAGCQKSRLRQHLANLSIKGLIHSSIGSQGVSNPLLYERSVEPSPAMRKAESFVAGISYLGMYSRLHGSNGSHGRARRLAVITGVLLVALTVLSGYLIVDRNMTLAEEARHAEADRRWRADEAAAQERREAQEGQRARGAASPDYNSSVDVLAPGDYRLALDMTWNGMPLADRHALCDFYLADPRGTVQQFESMNTSDYPTGLVDDFFEDKCSG